MDWTLDQAVHIEPWPGHCIVFLGGEEEILLVTSEICPEMHAVVKLVNLMKFYQSSRFERVSKKKMSDDSGKFVKNSEFGEVDEILLAFKIFGQILPNLSHFSLWQKLVKYVIVVIMGISGHKWRHFML